MLKVDKSRDFLSMVKSIIVFVRSPPKRQVIFHALQAEQESNTNHFVQLDSV